MEQVLLTVPHKACPPNSPPNHLCDFVAETSAVALYQYLGRKPCLLIGNIPRTQCDLNRIQCRQTKFRKELRKEIKSGDYKFVLDIHSYPPDLEDKELREWSKYDLVIMDRLPETQYGDLLTKLLQKAGVNCMRVLGSKKNDIVGEARENGLYSVLLEFKEEVKRMPYEKIAHVIEHEWIPAVLEQNMEADGIYN